MEARYQKLLEFFPDSIRMEMEELLQRRGDDVEEFRLRLGFPVGAVLSGREIVINPLDKRTVVDETILSEIIRRSSENSVYAVQEQIRRGFLALPGGHRVGICGRAVYNQNGIQTIHEIQSINLRISHEIIGSANMAMNLIWSHPGSTLFVGRPGCGKTTILRDAIRQLSDRFSEHVGVVDERGEIAACARGRPQFRVGHLTDVLTDCPKKEGIEILLRTMRPEWIALDEITAEEDVDALIRASYCGVRFLATAHTMQSEDLERRPVYRSLLDSQVFANLIRILPNRSLRCEKITN